MPEGENEDRAKTRERFNEMFKKYTESEKKKVKKKQTESKEAVALQTLKKNLNLEKDTEEDESILQNTYHPEDGSPRFTKNRRREKESVDKVNTNNSRNQDELHSSGGKKKSRRELPPLPPPGHASTVSLQRDEDVSESYLEMDNVADRKEPKRRSKKMRSKADLEEKTEQQQQQQQEEGEDALLSEYQQQIAQEEEEPSAKRSQVRAEEGSSASTSVPLNNDVGKKKKKKLKSVARESDAGEQDEGTDQDADPDSESKGRKKKKKKKKKAVRGEEDEEEEEGAEAEAPQKQVFDDSLVLSIYVHRTDRLKSDLLISHPMVKIHVVDQVTGDYVKKEDSQRPVSSFYESESVDHVLPIMTQPFDFKKNKSIIPEWEEQIIFNERFGHFVQLDEESPRVIVFFEILDFITMEEARVNAVADKQERGFRKIAWAFLKLVGTNGVLNIDSKLRLQLFCPPLRAKKQDKGIDVMEWWRKYPRNKYPSTLYVTVRGIKLPEHVDPCMRSMMALQEERGSTSYSELQDRATSKTPMQPLDSKAPVFRWSRMPGQICRIPNKPLLAFRGGQMGCFTLLFSHAGTLLAAACADRDAFPVVVYEIPSGKVLAAFSGHLKIVYDLCWSADDRSLLSASSDGTVREWNVEKLLATAHKVLPHPSFVYCAQYHPTSQNLVVTAGYDALVRVWRLDVDDVNGTLLQEFEGHDSFINTICFDVEGRRMFSADNAGVIMVWKTCHRWCLEKRIAESELSGAAISKLQLHPNGRRLLIHARDSILRMMDLRILAVKKYSGSTNYRERISSTFTPCGTFIFSGSEDGMAYVWNTETGDQVAVYSELCYRTALHGVSFHPHENMVAFCAFGQNQPVHLYLYDRKVSRMEAQNLNATGRSASSDTRTLRTTPDPPAPVPALPDPAAALDQLTQTTRLALKMRSVKEQLDSVLEPHQRSLSFSQTDKVFQSGRSLGADIATLNTSLLSPHSKQHGPSAPPGEQLLSSASSQRGFSPVGRRPTAAPSSLQLSQTLPDSASSGAPQEADKDQEQVVSLYDYTASRSDELTLHRGDLVQVLFKDNQNWWFGRASDGQQGYFPASYVTPHGGASEEVTPPGPAQAGVSEAERTTPTRVSAVVTSAGDLHFLSEPALSDTDGDVADRRARRKKKVKKSGGPAPSDPDASGSGGSRRAQSTRRPLPPRPSGRSNGAFEPDD